MGAPRSRPRHRASCVCAQPSQRCDVTGLRARVCLVRPLGRHLRVSGAHSLWVGVACCGPRRVPMAPFSWGRLIALVPGFTPVTLSSVPWESHEALSWSPYVKHVLSCSLRPQEGVRGLLRLLLSSALLSSPPVSSAPFTEAKSPLLTWDRLQDSLRPPCRPGALSELGLEGQGGAGLGL